MKSLALVTNDDGIDSAFLRQLVRSLSTYFRVAVAAPASEQSWIGRALTRKDEVEVVHCPSHFDQVDKAWAISGTPSDCVNIALGNLLEEKPSIVCSGINIGYNTTETLILSSGTIAGAIEGALWDIPSVAFSKCVPQELFAEISRNHGESKGAYAKSLAHAADRAVELAREILEQQVSDGRVVNINFPAQTTASTEIVETVPAKIKLGSLFEEHSPGKYKFRFTEGVICDDIEDSDRAVLDAGKISRSILDFSRIGKR